jgi:hypothetical protein
MNLPIPPKWRALAGAFCLIALAGCSASSPEDVAKNVTENSAAPAASTDGKKPKLEKFVNSKAGLEGALLQNYVGFSLSVPSDWEGDRDARNPDAQNFIKVEKVLRNKQKGNFTLENLAVAPFKSSGTAAGDARLFPQVAQQLREQFSELPHFKKISEGPTTINKLKGYELRFESRADKTPHGPITVWGRAVLLPNPKPGNRNGVLLTMLATSLQKEIKSAADVGEKGELPAILKSFKFE